MKNAITVVIIVFSLPAMVRADIVTLPLAAEGRYEPDSLKWQADFDLGITFIKISHVYMDWSGEITAGLATDPMRPGPQPFPLDVGLLAYLGRNPGARLTEVYGGEATYPEPERFDYRSEFELLPPTTWSDLLDGQGTMRIGYVVLGGPYLSYVEFGFVDLSSATLVVEGTIVPEPATFLILAAGLFGIRLSKLYSWEKIREVDKRC